MGMQRAMNRLERRGSKRKIRPGDRAVRTLKHDGQTIIGLRVSLIMFGDFLNGQERNTRTRATSRRISGIIKGGLPISAEVRGGV